MTILNIRSHPGHLSRAIAYFQDKWANEKSRMVYEDCLTRSIVAESSLPVWYLMLNKENIIGCAGLITNDFISCMDLMPWLCALYIEPKYRGQGLGGLLIKQIQRDTAEIGFRSLYLCTDHIGYYERYGFEYICDGYHPWGESSRVYEYKTDCE